MHLNYHHLRYFWAVAKDGNLTRTAAQLRVAPSALSAQIKQLEEQLEQKLFERKARALELTEAGRLVLAYAEGIFTSGEELLALVRRGRSPRAALKVGAAATLSRNFQESFIRPLLGKDDVQLRLISGSEAELLTRLQHHEVDVVLTNRPVARPFRCRRIARQRVSLFARKGRGPLKFPKELDGVPLLLPGPDSAIRAAFDTMLERAKVRPVVVAEVDDMAMMRLLARDARAVALLPPVVVRDELKGRLLAECAQVPGLYEEFYAVTADRKFQHPLLETLLERRSEELLGAEVGG